MLTEEAQKIILIMNLASGQRISYSVCLYQKVAIESSGFSASSLTKNGKKTILMRYQKFLKLRNPVSSTYVQLEKHLVAVFVVCNNLLVKGY